MIGKWTDEELREIEEERQFLRDYHLEHCGVPTCAECDRAGLWPNCNN